MKKTKVRIIILTLFITALFAAFGIAAYADEGGNEPTLKIEAANLSFDDSVYVLYAVSHNGIESKDITMLFWSEAQDDQSSYVKGTESYSKSAADLSETVKSADCVIFENDELRAKNMADYVYARAYAVVDGVEYYSEVSKYSILQYAYNKLGYTGTESTDTALKNMLTSMLNYGADAQEYFSHNTARPANGTFYQIKVEGGTLEDGFTKGLYLATESATLSAPEKSGDQVFAGWKNSAGEIYSTDNPLTLTDFSANETYTATYEESVTYSEGLKYTLSDDETYYIVAGIGACTDTEVVIPSLYNGLPVKEIRYYAFYHCTSLTSVTIPDSVTSIGDNAFYGCSNLTNVTIGNSVTSIGGYAFFDCSSLTSVNIPDSVTSIRDGAFAVCSSLTSVKIPESVTSIGNSAFRNCTGLTSVTIGNSVTSIGEDAFRDCTNLIQEEDKVYYVDKWIVDCETSVTSVTLRENTIGIADSAFYGCTGLTNLTIPDSVTSIGNYAFSDCSSLTNITIPDSVTSIGYDAFENCKSLTIYCEAASEPSGWNYSWNYSNHPVVWGYTGSNGVTDDGFKWASVTNGIVIYGYSGTNTETVIPEKINGIDVVLIIQSSFRGNTTITSVTIPDSVTSIGDYAFENCSSLTSVTIGNSVTSIGDYAFENCSSLTSVTIGNSVTSIGDDAFEYCTSLTSITIPDSVTNIGEYAFSDCSSLTSVTIPDSVTSIGEGAFYGCTSLTSVTIGNSVTSIGDGAFSDCTSLTSINVRENNTAYTSIDGNLYSKDSKTLIQYAIGKTDISFTIPDSVTSIGDLAFYGCTSLTSVTIGNSVTIIGDFAFENCKSLTSVTIPDSVTSIGDAAFSDCSSLTSVTIGNGVTSIGIYAFAYCTSLTIYCEAASKPSGWNSDWNYSNRPVVWGYTESLPSSEGLAYTLSDDETYYIVTGIGTCTDTEVVIPSLYNGLPVKEIVDFAFSNCTSLTSVIIPNSVTSIGYYAFSDCTSLTSVTIPDSVTSIGGWAFFGCTSLTSVIIPESVTSIGNYAFANCSSLTSITIPDSVTSIGDFAFYDCINLIQEEDEVYYVDKWIVDCDTSVTSVTLRENTIGIAGSAFSGCTSLASVVIPDSVTSIGEWAFRNCTGLTSVTIDNSVTNICSLAFFGCTSLTSVTIPASVTSIGEWAFRNCTGLTSILVAEGNSTYKSIDGNLYSADGKTLILYAPGKTNESFSIPDSVTNIGSSAFEGCSSLTSVTIPDSVTSIGSSAFSGCTSLTSVHITDIAKWCEISFDDSVITIGGSITYANPLYCAENLYLNGNLVTELTIPNGVTSIGYCAFYGYTSLTSITIPDTVTSIGSYAFSDCTSLASVTIGNSVTSIDDNAFCRCTSLTSINVGENNTAYKSIDGNLYSKDGKTLIQYAIGKTDSNFIIPNGVTSIGDYAFYDCTSLTSVTIPDSVTSIGDYVFRGCTALVSVNIPDNVTSIGDYVFRGCTSLTSVTIPNNVTSIGEWAFYSCGSLTSVTIGNSVTHIGYRAFEGCTSLTSVTIPDSVTSISEDAFSGCSSLTIYCEAASKPSGWDSYWNSSNCPVVWGYTGSNGVTDDGLKWASGTNGIAICEYSGTNTEIVIPKKINGIDIVLISENAFSGNTTIASVTIPDSVTSIGDYAFENCSSLTSVTIGNSVTSIGDGAFYYCTSLTSITIPDSVTSIGNFAFRGCTGLTSVTIPESVTSIGEGAFYGCTSLTSVTIPESVTSIGNYAFSDCTSLTSINVSENNAAYKSIDGNLYSKDLKTLIQYAIGKTDTSFTIPDSVRSIENYVFRSCTSLTSVTIPDSVTIIGDYAFDGCTSLTSVTIGNSVTSIGEWAFRNCTSLTIYCEAASQPSGWDSYWNYSNCPVVWGYTGEEYTYKFVTNGEEIESIATSGVFTLPTPTREGWYFGGWYDNAELSGNPVSNPYYSATTHTLYAKWMTEEEYLALLDGSAFEKAYIITSGESLPAVIDTAGEYVYFKFTATESKTYTFQSSGSYDTYGYLYNSGQSQLSSNDDGAGNGNFKITRSMSAGETVYIAVRMYSGSSTGTFSVSVS